MSLKFFDGFETYDLNASVYPDYDINDVWMLDDESDMSGSTLTIASSDRISGGQLLNIVHGSASNDLTTTRTIQLPIREFLADGDTIIVGAAIRCPDGLNGAAEYTHLFDFDSNCTLRLRGNGDLRLDRVTLTTSTNVAVATGAIPDTDWHYIEAKITFHNSTGTYDIRVDGVSVMSGTGNTSETASTTANRLVLGHVQNKRLQYDDFYICDDSGSTNNNFLSEVFVQKVRPNAVGDSSQLTPTSGDNYTNVDEDTWDSDTTYVESRTTSEKDLYNYENLDSGVVGTIFGVIAKPVLKKTDGGARTYRLLAKSGATESNSGTRYPNVSYVRQGYIWETDPDTSAQWTVSGFNAAQFGIQVVA